MTGDSDDIARSSLQTLIEEFILALGVLSVGYALLEQVTVIFLAPTGAHKQTPPPPSLLPRVPVEGYETPREAGSRPIFSLVFPLTTDRPETDKEDFFSSRHCSRIVSIKPILCYFFWTSPFSCVRHVFFCIQLWWDQTGKSMQKAPCSDSDMKHPRVSVNAPVVRKWRICWSLKKKRVLLGFSYLLDQSHVNEDTQSNEDR